MTKGEKIRIRQPRGAVGLQHSEIDPDGGEGIPLPAGTTNTWAQNLIHMSNVY